MPTPTEDHPEPSRADAAGRPAAATRTKPLALGPATPAAVPWAPVGSLTVCVPIARKHVASLEGVLARIDQEVRNDESTLSRVEGLHVARWVLLPERVRGCGIRVEPSLVMWTVFDGTLAAHLAALAENAGDVLDRIYEPVCPDYRQDRAGFLRANLARGRAARYVGTPGLSVKTICDQDELASVLAGVVQRGMQAGLPNTHILLEARRYVREELAGDPQHGRLAAFAQQRLQAAPAHGLLRDLAIALARAPTFFAALAVVVALGWGVGRWLGVHDAASSRGIFLLLYLAALVTLVGGAWASSLFFRIEPREALTWIPIPDLLFRRHDADLRTADNEGAGMNRMTILTDVRRGWVRWITLRFVLWLVAFRARRNFEGRLEGVETIHFAQWLLVDRGRRLLFLSNYDGAAMRYLADFSANATPGVNAIWGNSEGFPPTTALVGDGARDLEAFQNAARMHQIATNVWYCGYPNRRYSTGRINDNARIHRLLNEHPTPSQADEWVRLVEGYRA